MFILGDIFFKVELPVLNLPWMLCLCSSVWFTAKWPLFL